MTHDSFTCLSAIQRAVENLSLRRTTDLKVGNKTTQCYDMAECALVRPEDADQKLGSIIYRLCAFLHLQNKTKQNNGTLKLY